MKLSDIKININAVEKGDWVGDIPEMGDLRLRVRGTDNADYSALQDKLLRAARRRNGNASREQRDQITATLLLETVLLDWDGILDENNRPIPYSKDFAQTLLTDPEYRDFRMAVIWAADQVARTESKVEESDRGNLLKLSI